MKLATVQQDCETKEETRVMKQKIVLIILEVILLTLSVPLIPAEKTLANIFLIVVAIIGIFAGGYQLFKK